MTVGRYDDNTWAVYDDHPGQASMSDQPHLDDAYDREEQRRA